MEVVAEIAAGCELVTYCPGWMALGYVVAGACLFAFGVAAGWYTKP